MTTILKQKKVKNMRQKLKLFRANEPLKSVLMWGINYSFSALNHVKPRVMLLKDDFKAYMKVKVNNHLFNKENMPSRFKYKEYCPMVFKSLRERFAVNAIDYWDAFTRHQPLWDSTRGKSGSKFLVTYNRQFVAKTISSEEVEQMHHMIEEYYAYIVKCHGQTLLPQYLGLYRLTVNDQEIYILVMRNVFSPRLAIHKKYDLKGSAIEREANEKEKSRPLPTLKDTDFLNDVCKIHISSDAKTRLLQTLESDIQFLVENNLMDYSLLIGIHEVGNTFTLDELDENQVEPNRAFVDKVASAGDGLGNFESHWHSQHFPETKYSIIAALTSSGGLSAGTLSAGDEDEEEELGFSNTELSVQQLGSGTITPPDSPPINTDSNHQFNGELHPNFEFYGMKSSNAAPKPLIYFIAIIDILTRYGMRKRTAQTYKNVKHGSEASTVKPELYGRRLLDFVTQCVD